MIQNWIVIFACLPLLPGIAYAGTATAGNNPAPLHINSSPASGHLSLAEYQARLESLKQQVAECQQASANCSSEKDGHDLTRDLVVDLPSGPRQVSYGWLRTLLDQANHPNPKPQIAPKPAEDNHVLPTIAQQLEFARQRLSADQRLATEGSQDSSPSKPARDRLTAILASREYHTASSGRSIKDRVLEKIANWIDSVVGALVRAGSKSKWIGLTAEIGFVALLAVGLVWFLIRLERQARLGLLSIGTGPGMGAASERDWRLWAEDARQAAALGAWREAIHSLYWSSISRLESSGLWSADRARTPREYLALVAGESTQRVPLAALTCNFERTWYAGNASTESDYRQAEQQASHLSTHLATERGRSRGAS